MGFGLGVARSKGDEGYNGESAFALPLAEHGQLLVSKQETATMGIELMVFRHLPIEGLVDLVVKYQKAPCLTTYPDCYFAPPEEARDAWSEKVTNELHNELTALENFGGYTATQKIPWQLHIGGYNIVYQPQTDAA